MTISPAATTEKNTHITAFGTVRGLAALSYRFVGIPNMTLDKSLPKRFSDWKMCRVQSQPVSGK